MTSVCIESTLNWSKMTCIDWTSFEMANEQPRLQLLDLWLSVYMASNVKKKCKLIKKKHLARGNFVLFSNLFHRFREYPIVSKLKQSTCKVINKMFHSQFISIFFYLSPNRTWNFVTKISHYQSFPIITGHGTGKVLLMKFEILELAMSDSPFQQLVFI